MKTFPEDLFFSPLPELNRRLKAREFKAEELCQAWADRLETLGPKYNALALSLRKQAIEKAKIIDKEIKRKRHRGILHGIPYGAKDLLSFGGYPTEWGAPQFKGQVFPDHARAIDRLEGIGALCIGKLSMVELAGGGGYRYPDASVTGPGLNPWDVTRWSGGSSSGSGAAVAAGLVAFALGSETWGSILTPASYCGVSALRPTYGLVSRSGAMALSWTMDKIGPMCRTAEDCGFVLQAIAGGDSNDVGSAGKSFYYAPQFVRKHADIRIGWAPSDYEGLDAPNAKVFDDAIKLLKSFGYEVKEVELADLPYRTAASTIIGCEGASTFEPLLRDGRIDQLIDKNQAAGLKAALDYSATDYLKAMRIRTLVQSSLRELFSQVDVLIAPSRANIASKIDEALDGSGSRSNPNRAPAETPVAPSTPIKRGLRDLSAAGNLAGLPALSLPCGFVDGMPLGLSLVTRPLNENMILAMGKQFQDNSDWHKRRPAMPALSSASRP